MKKTTFTNASGLKILVLTLVLYTLILPTISAGVWSIPTENIKAYYKLNDDSATSTVIDSLGLTNGSYANFLSNITSQGSMIGKINNSLSFDGVNDFINLTSNTNTSGNINYSFSFWFKLNKTGTHQNLLGKWLYNTPDANGRIFTFAVNSSNKTVFVVSPDGTDAAKKTASSTTTIQNNTWYFVTGTYNGTGINIYINGILEGTTAHNTGFANKPNTPLGVGMENLGADIRYNFVNGTIDEIGIFNKSLNQSEILFLYSYGNGNNYPFSSVILNSPSDNSLLASSSPTFNCSATPTSPATLVNISLWTNATGTWQRNETQSKTGITNTSTFTKTLPQNATIWNCQACDSDGHCSFASSNYTININRVVENSRTYNTSSYITQSETFSLNISSDGTQTPIVYLVYNGTSYLTTLSSGLYTKTVTLDSVGNKSFYWSITYGTDTITTSTSYQNVSDIIFTLCNSTYATKFLNITFKDESDNSRTNATIPYSLFTYYIGDGSVTKNYSLINNTLNYEYDLCANINTTFKVLPYVQYVNDNSPQRIWNPAVTDYTNALTNQTLYLLSSVNGIYVTYQVVNNANQLLSGVDITATRQINGVNTEVGVGTTSADGTVTFWLNPDFTHTVIFSKSGFTDYTLVHIPTQSSYTVTLGGGTTTNNNYFQGVSYAITPKGTLYNNTTYSFEFDLTSSFWDVDSFGFSLRLANGTIVGSDSSTSSAATYSYNTNNQTIIYMDYYWIIEGNRTNATTYWSVINSENTSWSIKTFFEDLNSYIDSGIFGLDDFGRYLIVFIIIFISVGVVSYKYGFASPTAVTTLIFGIVFFFDVVVDLIPTIRGINNLLTYITALVLLLMLFRESER